MMFFTCAYDIPLIRMGKNSGYTSGNFVCVMKWWPHWVSPPARSTLVDGGQLDGTTALLLYWMTIGMCSLFLLNCARGVWYSTGEVIKGCLFCLYLPKEPRVVWAVYIHSGSDHPDPLWFIATSPQNQRFFIEFFWIFLIVPWARKPR